MKMKTKVTAKRVQSSAPAPRPPRKAPLPQADASRAVVRRSTPSAAAATPTPAPALAATPELARSPKHKNKLVRDSFTIPKSEYVIIESLKIRAGVLARPVKKSELLRAGIAALSGMNDKAFLKTLDKIPSLKTGRPKEEPAAPVAAP